MAVNAQVEDTISFSYEGEKVEGIVLKVTRKGVDVRQTSPAHGKGDVFWVSHDDYRVLQRRQPQNVRKSMSDHVFERYLEFHSDRDNSHKFYHVFVERFGAGEKLKYEVVRRWGRVGTEGVVQSEILRRRDYGASVTMAAKDHAEKLVATKLKKGYRDKTAEFMALMRNDPETQDRLIRAGVLEVDEDWGLDF